MTSRLLSALSLLVLAGCSSAASDSSFERGGKPGGGNGGGLPDGGIPSEEGGTFFDGGDEGGGSTGGGVPQTCADAQKSKSYIGCEYWPTVTSNTQLKATFPFAIAAANPTSTDAVVTVARGATQVAQVTVKPGQLQTVTLPWVTSLKDAAGSALVAGGAYHVTSSVPVTVYQFNPLEFQAGQDFSYTNDASLLMPTSALRGEYWVLAYPTLHFGTEMTFPFPTSDWTNLLGFVSITGTADGTTVTVRSAANVAPGGGVGAMTPGQTKTFQLNAGDVLQLKSGAPPDGPFSAPGQSCEKIVTDPLGGTDVYCPMPQDYDLTGSWISADKPVAVVGGHDCTFLPFDKRACDHIEETLFPVETLGQDLLVTAPQSIADVGAPNTPDFQFVRLISAADANDVTFDPPSIHAPVKLSKGQWIEIGPVLGDFRVQASDKIMVAQYMVGQDFRGSTGMAASAGDPSQSIAIPTEQYRLSYEFLAPATYTYNYVNLVAPAGATITLDGVPVPASEFGPIGSSGWTVARHAIPGGAHHVEGTKNFGIVVYGYASYTSYMYPGGLNLETIVIGPH